MESSALPDGKFLCSCNCTQYDGQPVGRVFRIHEDGALDTTFQTDVNTGSVSSFYPLDNGRVLVGGNFRRAAEPDQILQLVRFMPNGSLDPTFNNYMYFGVADGVNSNPKVTNIVPWHDDKYFVMGAFRNVDGETRSGICVTDTTGQLLPFMEDCLTGPFTYFTTTSAFVHGIVPTPDGTGFYINGTYSGYSDGTINDPGQRFVSRLFVKEVNTAITSLQAEVPSGFQLYPNPSTGKFTVQLAQFPINAELMVHDALGREMFRQRVRDQLLELDLKDLGPGIYMLLITSPSNGSSAVKLLLE